MKHRQVMETITYWHNHGVHPTMVLMALGCPSDPEDGWDTVYYAIEFRELLERPPHTATHETLRQAQGTQGTAKARAG